MGHWLTVWTIRISLALFSVTFAVDLLKRERRSGEWLRKLAWTAGFIFFLFHVACAFHFYHRWSHQAALEDTARQTKELMGWAFGEGIYFSYLFLLVWGADVAFCWFAPQAYTTQPTWLRVSVVAYLAFIAFNGAVIFESGPTRIAGSLVALIFGVWLTIRWRCT